MERPDPMERTEMEPVFPEPLAQSPMTSDPGSEIFRMLLRERR